MTTPSDRIEELRRDVLLLRRLVARLPLTSCEPSDELQAWYDKMKMVMEATNPTWEITDEDLARAALEEDP